jgi:DNA-binding transcriptional MerR regulator
MNDQCPYTLKHLLALGITRSQARHWERRGCLKPVRQGRGWRRYSEEEFQRVRRIHCLTGKGLRPDAAARYEAKWAQREAERSALGTTTPPVETPTAASDGSGQADGA